MSIHHHRHRWVIHGRGALRLCPMFHLHNTLNNSWSRCVRTNLYIHITIHMNDGIQTKMSVVNEKSCETTAKAATIDYVSAIKSLCMLNTYHTTDVCLWMECAIKLCIRHILHTNSRKMISWDIITVHFMVVSAFFELI